MELPEKLEFNLETSFRNFGEFVFKETREERPRVRKEKPAKEQSLIYVFPKSTAAIAEL